MACQSLQNQWKLFLMYLFQVYLFQFSKNQEIYEPSKSGLLTIYQNKTITQMVVIVVVT